jgi:O-Antigen ligase
MTLAKLLTLPYFFLLFVGLLVPSDGQHGLLSIKSLAFVIAMGALGFYALLRQKVSSSQLKLFSFGCAILSLFLFWLLVSLMQEPTSLTSPFDQFKLFLITLAIPLTTLYLVQEQLVTPQQFYKAVIYASFAYALLKVLIVSLHLLNLINAWKIFDTLGIRYMRMGIYGGLDRVQTSVDMATPFILFFLLNSERLGIAFKSSFRYAYLIVSVLSTFFSFSRYLILMYLASCFLYWLTLKIRPFIKIGFWIALAAISALFAVGPEKVQKVIERRFFSLNSNQSDSIRVKQAQVLLQEYEKAPFMGKGIGGYVPDHLRDQSLRHSYEVQWLAFLMQFGLFGLLFLLSPLIFIAWRLVEAPFSRIRYSFLGAFLLWLLSGFTNPFLISLTSGIIYTLFCLSTQVFTRNIPLQYDGAHLA